MKTAGCIGTVLPDGRLSVAPDALSELGLRPNERVQVVLIPLPEGGKLTSQTEADKVQARHEAWEAVMELRKSFQGMDFSLTDEVVRMREEEDV